MQKLVVFTIIKKIEGKKLIAVTTINIFDEFFCHCCGYWAMINFYECGASQ
jgi:hypothetical protein